jgi:glycosyltransferase involved in cell wall biosynthesis
MASVLPWHFGIILPRLPAGNYRSWDPGIRPLPLNATLFPSLEEALCASRWDWILTHNAQDLVEVREKPHPKVFLVHGTLSGRILQDRSTIDRTVYLRNLQILLDSCESKVVYISELKRKDWGLRGRVIRTAIDPTPYGGYRGELAAIVQVCNNIRERGEMLGWRVHRKVCRGFQTLILGENRNLAGSRRASDWEDLKEQYRSHRVYLHTAAFPYEDGYNLSMLEAMATGMPIATLNHPSSPVEDGVEGVVGLNEDELRQKISELMESKEKATELGLAARRKLEREFPLDRFQSEWQSFASSLV